MKLDHPLVGWLRRHQYTGFHDFQRSLTIQIARLEPDPDKAVALAHQALAKFSRRPPQAREVENLMRGAYDVLDGKVTSSRPPDSSAPPCPDLQTKFAGKAGDFERLKLKSSQAHFDSPGRILSTLFRPEDHVAVGRDKNGCEIYPVASLPDLSAYQFVLPVAMRPGATDRKAASILERRYYVHEFDPAGDPDFDLQAGYVMKLAEEFDLRLVVFSGGKSLHAWFTADPARESQFFRLSQTLGGDSGMALPTQFCRLPLGFRPGGGLQQVVFYGE